MSNQFDNRNHIFITFSDVSEDPSLSAVSSSEPTIGQVIGGKYQLLEKVGEGAMAHVYKAREIETKRVVAIKTLKFSDPDLAQRFAREVSIHSKLKHPHIVEAIDCITTQGRSYFVMEYLNGPSIEDYLGKKGRFENFQVISKILAEICEALEYAHGQGVIHRDIKPENIILIDSGGQPFVKVVDFGVAKIQVDLQRLTKTGVVIGSPAYMSPEQCMGIDLSTRSDLYSLGVVAFELITGSLPFDAETPVEMMEAHCDPDIKATRLKNLRPDFPAVDDIQRIFDRVLQPDSEDRPESIDEFKRELAFWWRKATRDQPDLETPFKLTPRSKTAANKKEKIVSTTEAEKLTFLVEKVRRGSGTTEDTTALPPSQRKPADKGLKTVGSWLALILGILSVCSLLAYLIITNVQ